MKSKLRIACAALLAATAFPALALQLGEIQVKSALNQPLVAAIPLQPKNLTELDGLTVGLAAAEDFARSGLQVTPIDQALQFHVVTDNNGQKLILVTSTQPITEPYLDFLLQVNTREGKQVHEFVVLLNPVIAAPAPAVQAAPVASAPSANPAVTQAAEPPAASKPQPQAQPEAPAPQAVPAEQHGTGPAPQPEPQVQAVPAKRHGTRSIQRPAPQPRAAAPSGEVDVQRGDTLSGIASGMARDPDVSLDQLMLALKAANPDAFFKNNINNLKAGAILRIPTRDLIDQRSAAAAAAEVHRQYESWRAAKPHPATVVEGAAAQAAANAAPKPGKGPPASDHLTLVPPTGETGSANSRPGVAGGTGTATVTGLRQHLQATRDSLVSLNQSNSDLESRVHSLQDISAKSDKLLSLKDATIAELQHKLAAVHSGTAAPAASTGRIGASATVAVSPAAAVPKPAANAVVKPATEPAAKPAAPWYMRPIAWVIAGVVTLLLIIVGFSRQRRPAVESPSRGPLADPDDVSPRVAEPPHDEPAAVEAGLPAETVAVDAQAHPDEPESGVDDDPYGLAALREPAAAAVPVTAVELEPPLALPATGPDAMEGESMYSDDPVDTKLDLARAYLDMGDPVGARAMLEEVLEEGTQAQQDEAKRLLADAEA